MGQPLTDEMISESFGSLLKADGGVSPNEARRLSDGNGQDLPILVKHRSFNAKGWDGGITFDPHVTMEGSQEIYRGVEIEPRFSGDKSQYGCHVLSLSGHCDVENENYAVLNFDFRPSPDLTDIDNLRQILVNRYTFNHRVKAWYGMKVENQVFGEAGSLGSILSVVHSGLLKDPRPEFANKMFFLYDGGDCPSKLSGLSVGGGLGNGEKLSINGNAAPYADNSGSLGTPLLKFSSVYAHNGTIQTSDARKKTDVQPVALGLDFINDLNPVSYRYKVGGYNVVQAAYIDDETGEQHDDVIEPVAGVRRHWGFLAQEVKDTIDKHGVDFAGWTLDDPDNPESGQGLRYDQFISPLVKAVQELSLQVNELKREIAELKA